MKIFQNWQKRKKQRIADELIDACSKRDDRRVDEVLAKCADLAAVDSNGNSPLHYTVDFPHSSPEIATQLIQYGFDVNGQNHSGRTVLHRAASLKQNVGGPMMELFLRSGGDVHIADNEGNTPLHDAARTGAKLQFMMLLNCCPMPLGI